MQIVDSNTSFRIKKLYSAITYNHTPQKTYGIKRLDFPSSPLCYEIDEFAKGVCVCVFSSTWPEKVPL